MDGVAVKRDEDPDSNSLYVKVIYHVIGQDADGAKLVQESIISGK